ncbi:phosphoribosyltransferase family protein [Kitasatospora sp. NPDC002227]|uniref:phosphoribosyltransferase family protein n=1 Tax=Kitasatospora sp. NPDC002227 TaxID=3154773 RepID=UPI0033302434
MPRTVTAHQEAAELLAEHMFVIPDFPLPGIRYIDYYRSVDRYPKVRGAVLRCFEERYRALGVDAVAGIGGGGFGFGMCLAHALDVPFHSIRKAGDTVYDALTTSVGMNYAQRSFTLASDVVTAGARVLLVDDTIASGGSASGAVRLLREAGAEVVELAVLFEIPSKGGREAIAPVPLFSVLRDEPAGAAAC